MQGQEVYQVVNVFNAWACRKTKWRCLGYRSHFDNLIFSMSLLGYLKYFKLIYLFHYSPHTNIMPNKTREMLNHVSIERGGKWVSWFRTKSSLLFFLFSFFLLYFLFFFSQETSRCWYEHCHSYFDVSSSRVEGSGAREKLLEKTQGMPWFWVLGQEQFGKMSGWVIGSENLGTELGEEGGRWWGH